MKIYEIQLGGSWVSRGKALVEALSDEKALEKAKRLYPQADEYFVTGIWTQKQYANS